VPLSTQAEEILQELYCVTGHGKYVFLSLRTEQACMNDSTTNAALPGMGLSKVELTAHGFRATARTIPDEVLNGRGPDRAPAGAPRHRSEWAAPQSHCAPVGTNVDDVTLCRLSR